MFDHKSHKLFLVSYNTPKQEFLIIHHLKPHPASVFKFLHPALLLSFPYEMNENIYQNPVLETLPGSEKLVSFLSIICKLLIASLPIHTLELAVALPRT
jgi:hypothetical protein